MTADSGTVLPLFTIPAGGREQFVVLQVTGRRPEGDIKYEDVRDRIREQLGQQLAIRRYLDRLRKATYVEIGPQEDGKDGRTETSGPRSRDAGRSARHRSRDRGPRAGSAARCRDHDRRRGRPDRGDTRAAQRSRSGTWGLGSGDADPDRKRMIRAGRIAGHAVEAAVKLAPQRRGRCHRHRSRPQARPPSRRLSVIPVTPSGWPISPATSTWR